MEVSGVGASTGVSAIGGVAIGDGGSDIGGSGIGCGGVDFGGDGVGTAGEGDGWDCGGCGLGGGVFGGSLEEELPQFLLQSTGRLTTGKHCLVDFCFGLPGRQLLVSSNTLSTLGDGTHD